MTDGILAANELTVSRGGEEILHRVSLTVPPEAKLLIQGKSGAGKSTLFEILALLSEPEKGTLHIDGTDAFALSERRRAELRRNALGIVFQDFQLVPDLTARENARLPQEHCGNDDESWLDTLFAELAIESVADQYPSTLSGGEKQRVAIARALANKPQIVFADEPTGQLDPETASRVLEVFLEARRLSDTALVVVSHDPQIADVFDDVYRLAGGSLRREPASPQRD